MKSATNDIAYTWCSCHSGFVLLLSNGVDISCPYNENMTLRIGASRPCDPLDTTIKVDDVETNPAPTTTHNPFWMCDICHKQIHIYR